MRYLEERNIGWKVGARAWCRSSRRRSCSTSAFGGNPKIRPTADCGYRAAERRDAAPVPKATSAPAPARRSARWAMATIDEGRASGRPRSRCRTGWSSPPSSRSTPSATSSIRRPGRSSPACALRTARRSPTCASCCAAARCSTPRRRAPARTRRSALVATNARLTKAEVNRVALMADDGFARAIVPSHTTGDGDTVFALATGRWTGEANVTHDRRAGRRGHGRGDRPRRVARPRASNGVPSARELGTVPARLQVSDVDAYRHAVVRLRGVRRRRCGGRLPSGRGVGVRARRSGHHPADGSRPAMPQGVAAGDVGGGRAVIWSRTDRPARLVVEYATTERFAERAAVRGPAALETHRLHGARRAHRSAGRPAHLLPRALPGSRRSRALSEPQRRQLPHAATGAPHATSRFAWSADTVGQGWGINPNGAACASTRRCCRREPDVFIHCGDTIYADGRCRRGQARRRHDVEERRDRGQVEGRRDARRVPRQLPLQPARRAHAPLQRRGARRSCSGTTTRCATTGIPTRDLTNDARYTVKSVALLAARARQAFLEYNPLADPRRRSASASTAPSRTGPLVEVFALDLRSYRGPNSANRQAALGDDSRDPGRDAGRVAQGAARCQHGDVEGDRQRHADRPRRPRWREPLRGGRERRRRRRRSGASSRSPISAVHPATQRIRNVVWITGDVHYCAAHHYDPARAQFTEFDPFWEFVAGPLHAGTFGPATLDATFGPEVKFVGHPAGHEAEPPAERRASSSSGRCASSARTRAMTVQLHDLAGKVLYRVELPAARRNGSVGDR